MTWDSAKASEFMLSKNWQTLEPFRGTNVPWKSKHLICNEISSPRMVHIQSGRTGCLTCANVNRTNARKHDENFSLQAMKENGWEPLEPYKNNKAKWTAKCMDCGRVSTPSLGNVLAGRGHCGYCAGNRIDPNEAIEYMQLVGLIPQEDYISATHPWKCICEKCGNLTFPRFADVKLGVRCSTCTNSGMNYSQPSYFYIMTNPELSSIKVGISNNKSRRNRIEHHERSGWLLFFKKDFETGKEASDIENVVLRWLRVEKKLGVHLSEELMPYGGFSETVDAMEITPSEILKFVMSIQRGK